MHRSLRATFEHALTLRAAAAVSLGLTRARVLAFRDRTDRGAASASRVFDVALKLPEALRKATGAGLPDGLRTLGWERNEQCALHFTAAEGRSRQARRGKLRPRVVNLTAFMNANMHVAPAPARARSRAASR